MVMTIYIMPFEIKLDKMEIILFFNNYIDGNICIYDFNSN